jgi:predicted component of viral defense system (DUF524 family)
MRELLRLETDRVLVIWRDAGGSPPSPVPGTDAPGRVAITPRRPGLASITTVVEGVAMALPVVPLRLFEQRDYAVYARATGDARTVQIAHRDPNIQLAIGSEDDGHSAFGRVNFGSQIGRTVFAVLVDDRPELELDLEVFPSKLDYATDYEQLLSEVQRVLTGLALEYLRATFRSGLRVKAPDSTELEWLVLLRSIVGDLESALRFIAARPVRGLTREPRLVHASRIRRVDSAVRAAVRRGRGSGPWLQPEGHPLIRSRLEERQARPTLDTPEHRWLAEQVRQCRRRIGQLLRIELRRSPSERQRRTVRELQALEARVARLLDLEPLAAADGPPPSGFASLQLIGAPGYREAYRQCMALALGLRIEGGPFELSIKDLDELYEYWCYLAVLQIISEETGSRIDPTSLVKVQRNGLHVGLRQGRPVTVAFNQAAARRVEVTYNREFAGADLLIAQRPDILITFHDGHWPAMHLVLDAKYRVDASPEYVGKNDVPGPPQDALNVLHRYRDAIFDEQSLDARPLRSVIEAVALFPSSTPLEQFQRARLWRAIDRIGVGAIPLLPGNLEVLRAWLRKALARGGWELADRSPRHAAIERSHDWRAAAALPVLIAVLRAPDPQQHLAWIHGSRMYYLPKTDTQIRQFRAAKVAVYSPARLAGAPGPGAVTHVADVKSIDVVVRREIATPWAPTRPEQLQVCYRLGPVEPLDPPILNRDAAGRGQRVSTHRWSSMLALRRARELRELLLETEPEWRLWETLRARGIDVDVSLDPLRPGVVDAENPQGRAWFAVGPRRARYAGASGFAIDDGAQVRFFTGIDEACAFLLGE